MKKETPATLGTFLMATPAVNLSLIFHCYWGPSNPTQQLHSP